MPDTSSTSEAPIKPTHAHDPYQALRFRNFRLLLTSNFIGSLGGDMVTIAIGWELYERTGSALALGGVGLAQVLPVILLSLPAGHVADRYNRKLIVLIAQAVLAVCALALTWLSYTQGSLMLVYACLALVGAATAFNGPAASALFAQTVPEHVYANAATWSSSGWQLAAVLGPALGGGLIALWQSATPVYALYTVAAAIIVLLIAALQVRQQPVASEKGTTFGSLAEGLRFLRGSQILLAAITLDLFAVLLGGATMLLPIYAKDILSVGPTGLGWLRAAMSVGALSVTFLLAHSPPFKKAGRALLLAVAGFGLATIVFGISQSFWLSLVMLFILGGLDSVSVVIRHTLVLVHTPDEMRGRVSAVNSIFVASSNELGGFESGLVAQLVGPFMTVVGGGIGTILVVILVALRWPAIRRLKSLSEHEIESSKA